MAMSDWDPELYNRFREYRAEPVTMGARKVSRSSLKIRQLQAAHFRTQLSAAPLKPSCNE